MAELLGPTHVVPGLDSNAVNRGIPISPNDPHIQNITDPTRVGRPDGRTDQQGADDAAKSALPRFDSNFQTFFERLRQMPDLAGELGKLMLARQGTVISSGISEGTAADLSQLLDMMKMSEGQFTEFLETQMQAGARFGGALFSALRTAYQGTQSLAMREDILHFLKAYSDFSSTGHIEGNLLRNLNSMVRAIPASWGAELAEVAAKLANGVAAGDRAGNIRLLKDAVFPFMAKYVGLTHDVGRGRSLLTMLSLDLARYENGSETNVTQSFRQLLGYQSMKERFGGLDDELLMRVLRDTPFEKASKQNGFVEKLVSAAGHALRGEDGAETQASFREIVSSILINESVYMPLNHLIIPLEWNGRMMFSEAWVDPDAEKDAENGGEDGEGMLRFLFKMDIQRLGAFDIVLGCRGGQVDLRVRCPERVAPFMQIVQEDMARILADNGLAANKIAVEKMEKPLTITEVFPKILDGRNSVNVKV